jgi:uncharacterized protein (TIGR03435 family)
MKGFLALLAVSLVAMTSSAQTQSSVAQTTVPGSATAAASTSATPAAKPGATTSTTSAEGAVPEFEAATIKPVKEPDPNQMHDRTDGRRYTVRNATLRDLILMAYRVDRQQIAGGPAWTATDEYDVVAVAESDTQLEDHGDEMMRTLLAERFQLKFHWEQRERSVYALVVAKGGTKLKVADVNGQPNKGCRSLGNCSFTKVPLADFCRFMGFVVMDKPVVDKTGLAGEFDITLKWTPDETQFDGMGIHVPPAVDNPNAPPELFTAIQEELGLRLEPRKIPAEVLVIDHAERPSEN